MQQAPVPQQHVTLLGQVRDDLSAGALDVLLEQRREDLLALLGPRRVAEVDVATDGLPGDLRPTVRAR